MSNSLSRVTFFPGHTHNVEQGTRERDDHLFSQFFFLRPVLTVTYVEEHLLNLIDYVHEKDGVWMLWIGE